MSTAATAWSASVTASLAAESSLRSAERSQPAAEVGWPQERMTARPASGTGWPAADPAPPESDLRRPAERPEAYRHLWQPWGRKPPPRQALGRPYVWDGSWDGSQDGQLAGPDTDHGRKAAAGPTAGERPHERADGVDALTGVVASSGQAVIGDDLRQPAAWCQIGACIARHTDAAALGEADIRSRALACGWCLDAFGRLVCPSCQQHYPVWSARPLALRAQAGRQRGATSIQAGQHRRTYK